MTAGIVVGRGAGLPLPISLVGLSYRAWRLCRAVSCKFAQMPHGRLMIDVSSTSLARLNHAIDTRTQLNFQIVTQNDSVR